MPREHMKGLLGEWGRIVGHTIGMGADFIKIKGSEKLS
jgi:hypothetical protein